MIDERNLTQKEIKTLLKSVKWCTKPLPGQTTLPFEKIDDDTPVVDYKHGVKYELHRYRPMYNSKRFSLHIRFLNSGCTLIRVDINNGTHKNPDGTVIPNNHMHIYNRNGTRKNKDDYAYKLPKGVFNLKSIFTALFDFLNFTNTKNYSEKTEKGGK